VRYLLRRDMVGRRRGRCIVGFCGGWVEAWMGEWCAVVWCDVVWCVVIWFVMCSGMIRDVVWFLTRLDPVSYARAGRSWLAGNVSECL